MAAGETPTLLGRVGKECGRLDRGQSGVLARVRSGRRSRIRRCSCLREAGFVILPRKLPVKTGVTIASCSSTFDRSSILSLFPDFDHLKENGMAAKKKTSKKKASKKAPAKKKAAKKAAPKRAVKKAPPKKAAAKKVAAKKAPAKKAAAKKAVAKRAPAKKKPAKKAAPRPAAPRPSESLLPQTTTAPAGSAALAPDVADDQEGSDSENERGAFDHF